MKRGKDPTRGPGDLEYEPAVVDLRVEASSRARTATRERINESGRVGKMKMEKERAFEADDNGSEERKRRNEKEKKKKWKKRKNEMQFKKQEPWPDRVRRRFRGELGWFGIVAFSGDLIVARNNKKDDDEPEMQKNKYKINWRELFGKEISSI